LPPRRPISARYFEMRDLTMLTKFSTEPRRNFLYT
jgi:hypothetical protein